MANIKRIIDEYLQEQPMLPMPIDGGGGVIKPSDQEGERPNQEGDWSGGQNNGYSLKPIVNTNFSFENNPQSNPTRLPDWVGDLPRVDPGNGPMIYNGKLIIGGQRGFPEWGQLKPLPPKP